MDSTDVILLGLLKRALAERDIITVRVTGDCMAPHICEGDHVAITKERTLQVGDIILYCPPPFNSFYLHRIKEIKKNGNISYTCKGDSSPSLDPPIPEDQVIGKVAHHVTPEPISHHVDESCRIVLSPDVFYELQKDRILVFNASNGKILLLNPSILPLIQECKSGISVSEIMKKFPDKGKKVLDVVTSLVSEGILCFG